MVRRIRAAVRSAMVVATTAMTAGAALVAVAAPAQATTLGTCSLGTLGVTFNPGLGIALPPNLPRISVGLVPEQTAPYVCQLLNPSSTEHAQITALSGTMNASCLSSDNVHWSMTLSWPDRSPVETSSVELGAFALNITNISKIVALSGTVVSGRFSGRSVRLETVSSADSTRCLTNSLTNASGPATIEIS